MGADKALVSLGGVPLIVIALQKLRAAGFNPGIAGGDARLKIYGEVIPDRNEGLGPLGGVCAAIEATRHEYALFLSVDQPLLPGSMVTLLVTQARSTGSPITLASVNGIPQTFPAVIERKTLSFLLTELSAGRRSCIRAFHAAAEHERKPLRILHTEALVQAGYVEHPTDMPVLHWFLNVNRPEDLYLALNLAKRWNV